jgi:L-ascorbate metabolism protein UlaG (beta-lactamase superfamily)
MKVTYIHHSSFLVETERFYYLFDYEKGNLPEMDGEKPIFVLSSHGHGDHYNPEVFALLTGMKQVRAILSDDIEVPADVEVLQVSPEREYSLGPRLKLTTFRSTDLGVAFLIEDGQELIYHAGDLNDWVWEGEPEDYNTRMTADYRRQIGLLAETLKGREIDAAFVVLDPRQEKDYDRGLCYFLENISAKRVFPMHYWGKPDVIETFLMEHPEYTDKIQRFVRERGTL